MGAAGQRLGLRLFLEGLETPVVAAQVQISINSPALASIQVVPGDRILELRARTMVHLFFWDYTLDNEAPVLSPDDPEDVARERGVSVEEAKDIIAARADSPVVDELVGYKLLFCGEVTGVTYVKTPVGRQAVLQCADFSTYWDTTYQFMASASNLFSTSAHIWAGGASMFDDILGGHMSVLGEYLHKKPLTQGLRHVKGLMGGIIALLEAMGGVPKHMHGVNDFFTIGELKNHILQQIVCEQNDDTSSRLFSNKAFWAWLNNAGSSMGSMVTFRDMLKMLFKYIYYEVIPNPAAMYVPHEASTSSTKRVKVAVGGIKTDEQQAALDQLRAIRDRANMMVTHPMVPPEQAQLSIAQPPQEVRVTQGIKNDLQRLSFDHQLPERSYVHLSAAINEINRLPMIHSGTKATQARETTANVAGWRRVVAALDRALTAAGAKVVSRAKTTTTPPKLDRLQTQIFRPDCFFVAPPKCNVLFPDQYTQFQFSRNFLQEVTRLRLHEEWQFGINEGLLEQNVHFAPSLKGIKALAKAQGNRSVRALLEWEKYSGILPKFETIHEVNYAAGRSERRMHLRGTPSTKSKKGTKGTKGTKVTGAAVDYAQRVANFNYMKYRFAARSCEVSAKLNPFLVCGFPMVIIERPFLLDPVADAGRIREALHKVNDGREQIIAVEDISDNIRDLARELRAPTQYLGMAVSMSHNVDQQGGGTSVSLTHARTHRISDDDFLGIFSKELVSAGATEITTTTIDAEDALKKGDAKLVKFLIGATDQDMGSRLEELLLRRQKEEEHGTPEEAELESRPDDAPVIDGIDGAAFAPILNQKTEELVLDTDPSSMPSPTDRVSLVGEVQEAKVPRSDKTILEPVHSGALRVGSKGPRGGVIKRIQVHSDAAIMVSGLDVNKNIKVWDVVIIGQGTIDEFVRRKVKGRVVKDGRDYFMWRKMTVYEEIPVKNKKLAKLLPVEEALRPPWFSPLYSNWFIGDGIYQPFFGCGSIVDQALFVAPTGTATFGTGRKQQQEILDKLTSAGNDQNAIIKILEDAKAQMISDVPDVESSVDALAYIYGEVRRLGLDVHRFVNQYTHRPIATMAQILGSADLQYRVSPDGSKLELVEGTPGFHSTAIANVGNLLGLVDNPDESLPRLNSKGKRFPLSKDLDPRPGRRERVEAYLNEINASAGSLGVGVQG